MLHERSFACFSYICDLAENLVTKKDIDEEEREFKARSKPQHICITNATSPVAYHMINAIARGDCLGPDVEVSASECNSPWTILFNRSCITCATRKIKTVFDTYLFIIDRPSPLRHRR